MNIKLRDAEGRFDEKLKLHDIETKERFDLMDFQMEELKKENAVMKEEMKKCSGGKDLSKNVSAIIQTQKEFGEKQAQQMKSLEVLKRQVNESSLISLTTSKMIKQVVHNISHINDNENKLRSGFEDLTNGFREIAVNISNIEEKADEMSSFYTRSIIVLQDDIQTEAEQRRTKDVSLQRTQTKNVEEITDLIRKGNELNVTMSSFLQKMKKSFEEISNMNVTRLSRKVEGNKKFINQFYLYTRLEQIADHAPFAEIVESLGEENLINKNSIVVQNFLQLKKDFDFHSREWGVRDQFKDLVRITDAQEMRGEKNCTTIQRISTLYEAFTEIYNKKWQIYFKGTY